MLLDHPSSSQPANEAGGGNAHMGGVGHSVGWPWPVAGGGGSTAAGGGGSIVCWWRW